jgi:hypothetical protein
LSGIALHVRKSNWLFGFSIGIWSDLASALASQHELEMALTVSKACYNGPEMEAKNWTHFFHKLESASGKVISLFTIPSNSPMDSLPVYLRACRCLWRSAAFSRLVPVKILFVVNLVPT